MSVKLVFENQLVPGTAATGAGKIVTTRSTSLRRSSNASLGLKIPATCRLRVLVHRELESSGVGVREHRAAPCRLSRGLRPRRFFA